MELTLNANAKINLYLDVTGKRADGYHLLETVMHSVSLCDIVTMKTTTSGIAISCTDSSVPCDEKNIAYKCADAFFRKTGITNSGISINIDKRIPSQAGMGGGSADGAAVLKGMNLLYNAGLTDSQLIEIGAQIGADIPFCIKGGCGYCTGIGEIITPLETIKGIVVIGKGSKGISTKEAFEKIDSLNSSLAVDNIKKIFSDSPSISEISPYCRNIFNEVTQLDEVENIKGIMLESNAECSCMTGSGSAVFGLYNDRTAAEETSRILKEMGFFSAVCELTD